MGSTLISATIAINTLRRTARNTRQQLRIFCSRFSSRLKSRNTRCACDGRETLSSSCRKLACPIQDDVQGSVPLFMGDPVRFLHILVTQRHARGHHIFEVDVSLCEQPED